MYDADSNADADADADDDADSNFNADADSNADSNSNSDADALYMPGYIISIEEAIPIPHTVFIYNTFIGRYFLNV